MPQATCCLAFGVACALLFPAACHAADSRPNILLAIADDQSFPHASAYGTPGIATPGFDAVARRGVRFQNAFTPAPGCSPMRAALLTGRNIWQIGPAGTHASSFPADLPTFPDTLANSGYAVGYTGKGWGPGNFRVSGRTQNPAGPAFSRRKQASPKGISSIDYAANFEDFLATRDEDQPFCFWFGAQEPHRSYDNGIGKRNGADLSKISVPSFLPDDPAIRSDIADYFYEIEWFDKHLQRMLTTLEQAGELDNTLVIVTSDNGMPFPRAKANLYEFGIHMPLAICWPDRFTPQPPCDALVNLIDLTATIYDAAQTASSAVQPPAGRSLLAMLKSGKPPGDWPTAIFSGRERHSSSRFNTLGYPCRCIRTQEYLYIRNYYPERWPAGSPQKYDSVTYDQASEIVTSQLGGETAGYHDIDACPTFSWMLSHRDQPHVATLLDAAVGLRPADELYAIQTDPACLDNLADDPQQAATLKRLQEQLSDYLHSTGDLRELQPQAAHVWETHPRYSSLRWFPKPAWAIADPSQVPAQAWLEERRPR